MHKAIMRCMMFDLQHSNRVKVIQKSTVPYYIWSHPIIYDQTTSNLNNSVKILPLHQHLLVTKSSASLLKTRGSNI